MLSITKCCQAAWSEVCLKVNMAVVFLDDACAEALHWNGGAAALLNAGATDIKQFSSFESGRHTQRKAVFLLSSPLVGLTADITRDILQASSFQYAIVISSLSPAMHSKVMFGSHEEEARAIHQFEDQLLEYMGNMNYTAEVIYKPLVCAPVSPQLFVLPAHSELFPLLPTDLQALLKKNLGKHTEEQAATPADVDFTFFTRELQLAMKLLVCSLNSLLELLSISEDCFALGHTSRIIAEELAALQWAKTRRKSAQHKASLLLVDRTLDLVSVVGHHGETLLDRILAVLPRLPGHHSDVCTNMIPLCSVHKDCEPDVLVPGCLAHQQDSEATSLLSSLVTSKQKEALMEVNRSVVEAASTEGLPLKLTGRPGRVTVDQLRSHLALFRGKMGAIKKHSGVLQIAQATAETLGHPAISRLDSLLATEKGLLQSIGDPGSPSVLTQILNLLQTELDKPENERLYSLQEVLLLLLYLYSLCGERYHPSSQEETTVQSALTEAILNEDNIPDLLKEIVPDSNDPEKVFNRVQEIFLKLRGICRTRESLKQFRNVFQPGGLTSQASIQPLLREVTEQIFNPQKPEIPDLVHKSTGYNLLKSGFGLFMKVGKPRPGDQPLLIIFVIGGVTSTEVKQIKEAVTASKTSTQVLVGSTSLLTPEDMLRRVFIQDNLNPHIGS